MNFVNCWESKSSNFPSDLDSINVSIQKSLEWIFEPYSRCWNHNISNSYKQDLEADFSNEIILLSRFTWWYLTSVSIENLMQIHLSIFNIIGILKDLDFLYWSMEPQLELFIDDLKVMSMNLKRLWKHDFVKKLWSEINNYSEYFKSCSIIAQVFE